MIWLAVIALAVAVFAVLAGVLRAPRAGWEAIVAALMIGLAGYAAQGHPGVPGAPKSAREVVHGGAAA
ncbi:MAG TPA: cytochrome C biosynthesis protein, partial [Novosphingobium sp.]|nr:cytochrome C biosynthesis protein [Novosphingobium sp.]